MENQTKEKEKENQGDKTSTEDRNKNTSKTNKLGTRHFKTHYICKKDQNSESITK